LKLNTLFNSSYKSIKKMKKLKLNLLVIFMVTSFTMVNSQEKVTDQEALLAGTTLDTELIRSKDSTKKNTINSSDKKAQKVNFNGINYYVIDGLWHTKFKNKFILKQAPKGARLDFIPKGGKLVTMGGKKYYKKNGVFYKKVKGGFYEVARP